MNEIRNEWTYPDLLKALSVLDMHESFDLAFDGLMEEERKEAGSGS